MINIFHDILLFSLQYLCRKTFPLHCFLGWPCFIQFDSVFQPFKFIPTITLNFCLHSTYNIITRHSIYHGNKIMWILSCDGLIVPSPLSPKIYQHQSSPCNTYALERAYACCKSHTFIWGLYPLHRPLCTTRSWGQSEGKRERNRPPLSLSFFPTTSARLPYLFSFNFIFGIPVEDSVAWEPRPLLPPHTGWGLFLDQGNFSFRNFIKRSVDLLYWYSQLSLNGHLRKTDTSIRRTPP